MPTKQEYEVVIKTELLNLSNQIEALERLNARYNDKIIHLNANKAPHGTGRALEILKVEISTLEKNKAKSLNAYKTAIEQSIDDNEPNAKEQRRLMFAEGMLVLAKKQLSLADASSKAALKNRRGNINDAIKTNIWQSCMLHQADVAEYVKETKKELTAAENAFTPQPNHKEIEQPHSVVSQAIRNSIQKDARNTMKTLRESNPEKQNDSKVTPSYSRRSGME